MTIAHVVKVLMGEHLKNSARDGRHSGLRVITVVEFAPVPLAKLLGKVVGNLVEQALGEVLGCLAGYAGIKQSVVEVGRADGECAHDGVAWTITGITMHSQRQFDRHPESLLVGHIARTATHVVGHERARVDVVGIVVSAQSAACHRLVGHASPLGVIACTLKASRQTARNGRGGQLAARGGSVLRQIYALKGQTGDITHAATKPDGIGGDYRFLATAQIAHRHTVILAATLVKVEGTEIHPCAASHPLVNPYFGGLTFVPHCIYHIVGTVGKCGIADIHGISASLGELGLIGHDTRFLGLLCCRAQAYRARREGVFLVEIQTLALGESP